MTADRSEDGILRRTLNIVDRGVVYLFPKQMLPEVMLADDYWVGLFTGMCIGALALSVGISPKGGVELFIIAIASVALVRFVTWRVEKNA